jgi:hypothetical protein
MRFLLITFYRKPGGQIDEQVAISKKVKKSDNQTCNVILDFAEKKIQRCIIEGKVVDTDWARLVEYYRQIYPQLIEQLEREAPITAKEK